MNTPAQKPVSISAPSPAPVASKTPPIWTGGTLKGTRQSVLVGIGASGLSDAQKAVLVEAVGKIDKQFDLLRLDFASHNYNAGENTSYTLTEL